MVRRPDLADVRVLGQLQCTSQTRPVTTQAFEQVVRSTRPTLTLRGGFEAVVRHGVVIYVIGPAVTSSTHIDAREVNVFYLSRELH